MFDKKLGYVEKMGMLGFVTGADFSTGEYILLFVTNDGDSEYVNVLEEDVKILKRIAEFEIGDIYDGDVIYVKAGDEERVYEFELINGDICFYVLDKNSLKRTSGKTHVTAKNLDSLGSLGFTLIGNINELKYAMEERVKFNIEFVKSYDGKNYTYYYACNNKDSKEVDLIKVVFIGYKLTEEDYERVTMPYDEYFASLKHGLFEVVSQAELANYATGVMYGVKQEQEQEQENEVCDCDECTCVDVDVDIDLYTTPMSIELIESIINGGNVKENVAKSVEKDSVKGKCNICGKEKELCTCEIWDRM